MNPEPGGSVADTHAAHVEARDAGADEYCDVPAEMMRAPCWLVYRLVAARLDGGKPRKVPHYVSGKQRSGTLDTPEDRAQLASFDDAIEALRNGGDYAGLGFALGPDGNGGHWQGIDLDDVADHPALADVIDDLPGYTERSPSGNGFHAIGYGRKFDALAANTSGIEAYAAGRYFTVTGSGAGIHPPTVDLADFVEQRLKPMHSPRTNGATHARTSAPPQSDDESWRNALDALGSIPSDDRETWLKVGMGLHSTERFDAFDAWDRWSQSSDKYDAKDCERTWKSFRRSGIAMGTVVKLALDRGWRPKVTPGLIKQQRQQAKEIGEHGEQIRDLPDLLSIDDMIERFVYIEESQQVAPIDHPRQWLGWPAFRATYKASFTDVEGDNGRKSRMQHSDAWLASAQRRRAYTLTFRPGAAVFTRSPDDLESLNLWRARPLNAPDNWQELAAPFLDHVAYIIPDQDERGRFLDWLAHIEQRPGVLPHAHYLMVAKTHGIGRNWLGGALARIWHGHVALNLDLHKDMLGTFNHSLSRKLLAVIDELHEGAVSTADVYRSAEQLKAALTSEVRTINNKYGPKVVEFNCCRFLMLSNHGAALPITESDRRVIVIQNPDKPKEADYYTRLYSMFDERGFAESVRKYLAERDVGAFNPGAPAPMSEAKRMMIQASKSDLDLALEEIRTDWNSDCIRAGRILELAGIDPDDKRGTSHLRFAATTLGFQRYPRKVRIGEETGVGIYIIRNQQRWMSAPPFAVADEAQRGQMLPTVAHVALI